MKGLCRLLVLAFLILAAAGPAHADSLKSVLLLARRSNMTFKEDKLLGRATLTGDGGEIVVAAGSKVVVINGRSYRLRKEPRYKKGALAMGEKDFKHALDLLRPSEPPAPASIITAPLVIQPAAPAGKKGIRKVVIDPGHGGQFTGAIGPSGVKEKDVNLAIAQKFAAALRARGFEALLTRTDDRALKSDLSDDLDARCVFANRNGADLFVSIHANASKYSNAEGYETFVVDDRIPVGDRVKFVASNAELPAFDVGPPVDVSRQAKDAFFHLLLEEYWYESFDLARLVQKHLSTALFTPNRGIKHNQGLRLLRFTGCPAVLVEVGFLSNPGSEKELSSPASQQKIAEALAGAIVEFKDKYEK